MARKKLYAAIDVGSHDIQMKIAEISREEPPRVVEHLRRTLAIGTDTYLQGRISLPVINECVAVLSDFTSILETYRIGDCRTVATSAFREAQNKVYVIEQIRRGSQLQIDVLCNTEERYFHILAVAAQMPDFSVLAQEGVMLVDIGAGSIQITVFSQGELLFSQNMLLGSLRIRELLADLERRTADFAGLMEAYISSDLTDYHPLEPKSIHYKNLIVLGGEMDQLKILAGQNPDALTRLTAKQFDLIYQQILSIRPIDLSLDKSVSIEHASLLLPSAIIVRKLIDFAEAKVIHLPTVTLCDGILLDMAHQRHGFKSDYNQEQNVISACRHLASRFDVDKKHTDFVEKAALRIFDETERLHDLPQRSRLLLQAAAILHDCGKYISMTSYPARARDIILSTEIIGLESFEQQIVALTAYLHTGRSTFEGSEFHDLNPANKLQVLKLAAILRLANALDIGHKQKTGEFAVSLSDHELILTLSPKRDITLESWNYDSEGWLFLDVFGYKPVIKIRRQLQ